MDLYDISANSRVKQILPCYLLFLLSIVGYFTSSCAGNYHEGESDAIWNVTVPDRITANLGFNDFFRYSHYIILETSDDNFVANIGKIQFDNEDIHILNEQANNILTFDKKGKFVRKFDRHGRAGNEYITLSDMEISDDIIYALDRDLAKLKKYDILGNFLSAEEIAKVESFKLLDNGLIALYVNHGGSSDDYKSLENNYAVVKDGKIVYEAIPYSKALMGLKLSLSQGRSDFYSYNDSIFVLFSMKDIVYNVSKKDGHIEPYLRYKFPNDKPGTDESEQVVMNYWNNQGKKGYVSDLYNYMKFGDYNFIAYREDAKQKYVISKGDELLYNGGFMLDENGLPIIPVSYLDNRAQKNVRLLNSISPDLLKIIAENSTPDKINKPLIDEILSKVSDGDNPVLFFYDWIYN